MEKPIEETKQEPEKTEIPLVKKQNSKNGFFVLIIVVIILISGSGYLFLLHVNKSSLTQPTMVQTHTASQYPTQMQQTPVNAGLSNKTDTSNQQLDQDFQNVQNSMSKLQQDQATVNTDIGGQTKDTSQ